MQSYTKYKENPKYEEFSQKKMAIGLEDIEKKNF